MLTRTQAELIRSHMTEVEDGELFDALDAALDTLSVLPRTRDRASVLQGDIVYCIEDGKVRPAEVEPFADWESEDYCGDDESGITCWLKDDDDRNTGIGRDLNDCFSTAAEAQAHLDNKDASASSAPPR